MQKCSLAILFSLFGLFINSVFGGVTGKIAGKVTDNQTGNGLPAVNIILKGWIAGKTVELDRPMGAASDIDGNYFIINIPPGKYAITARMIGYQSLQYTDVLVSVGRTTIINFVLTQEAIELEEVSVTAKREIVQSDVSTSQTIISIKETENLPRNTIQEVIDLTPGISISNYNNKIDIRGGGSDQVMAYLDGFAMKDNVFNTPFLSYNRTSIEEISIQTGGFQAEYGELRSGLINVVTKEGGRDYSLSLDWKYSPSGYRYDGPKKYLEDKDYLMYGSDWSMDEEILREKFFPDPEQTYRDYFAGWPKLAETYLTDSDSTNDMSPNQRRQLWLWRHRGRPEGEKPDQIIDVTFSGPIPGANLTGIGNFFSKLSFMVSFRGDYIAYANPGYRDHFEEQNTMFKLKYNISNSTKLSLLGMYSNQWGLGYIDIYDYNRPVIMRIDYYRYDEPQEWQNIKVQGAGSYVAQELHLVEKKISNIGMHFEHIISPSTFFEFRVSRMENEYNFGHGPMRDTTKIKEIPAEYYTIQDDSLQVPGLWNPETGHYISGDTILYSGDKIWCPVTYCDETPNGWVYRSITTNPDQVGNVNFDRMTNDYERSRGSTTIIRGDITSQINNHHLLKAGFYYTESVIDRDNYKIETFAEKYDQLEGEGEDISVRYREVPRYGAIYFQDRIEIKGLTGNFGLRGEFFDANTRDYMPGDPFSNFFFIPDMWENVNRMEYKYTKPYYHLSPRFGISHPMTIKSKIYFNYGHAYTAPDNMFRYGFAPHPRMWSNIRWRGNPNLKPPKTVQYALGYEHVLFDKYLVHTEIYYKDVTDQLGEVYYQNVFSDNPTWRYYTWENKMYEDIIGFEFRLYKRFGRFFTGWLQTEFRGQKKGEIGYATRFVENDPENVSEFSKFSFPDDFLWEWTPSFLLNLDWHTPYDWGPKVLGHTILGGWCANGIIKWRRGDKWTWNLTNSPFIHNNMQNADYFSADIFISKDLKMLGINSTLYLDVRNLFSRKLLDWTLLNGPDDNPKSDQYKYLTSIEKNNSRVGHYKEDYIVLPPERPGERLIYRSGGPIRIYMGLRLNFNR